MDYFHNISVVNTQYERILINAVHNGNSTPEHSALKMKLFQSSLPLIVGVFEKMSVEYTFPHFLWNTHFPACENSRPSSLPARVAFHVKCHSGLELRRTAVFAGPYTFPHFLPFNLLP